MDNKEHCSSTWEYWYNVQAATANNIVTDSPVQPAPPRKHTPTNVNQTLCTLPRINSLRCCLSTTRVGAGCKILDRLENHVCAFRRINSSRCLSANEVGKGCRPWQAYHWRHCHVLRHVLRCCLPRLGWRRRPKYWRDTSLSCAEICSELNCQLGIYQVSRIVKLPTCTDAAWSSAWATVETHLAPLAAPAPASLSQVTWGHRGGGHRQNRDES